jgi:hypothetical protein
LKNGNQALIKQQQRIALCFYHKNTVKYKKKKGYYCKKVINDGKE